MSARPKRPPCTSVRLFISRLWRIRNVPFPPTSPMWQRPSIRLRGGGGPLDLRSDRTQRVHPSWSGAPKVFREKYVLLVFWGLLRGASLPAFEAAPLAQRKCGRVPALFRSSVLNSAAGGNADDGPGELIGVSTEFFRDARVLAGRLFIPLRP